MFESFDAETTWLTVTNIGLGIVTIICMAAVGYVAFKEFFAHAREKVGVITLQDDHSFSFGNLGITMADGGERIDERKIIERKQLDDNEPNIIRSEE
jgi:hypothetical protein